MKSMVFIASIFTLSAPLFCGISHSLERISRRSEPAEYTQEQLLALSTFLRASQPIIERASSAESLCKELKAQISTGESTPVASFEHNLIERTRKQVLKRNIAYTFKMRKDLVMQIFKTALNTINEKLITQ